MMRWSRLDDRGRSRVTRPRPEKKGQPAASAERRVLPMQLRIGDRLTDETGEYEIAGRPYTTNAGKDVHARVRRVDNAEVTKIVMYAAHERRRGEGV